MIQTQYFDRVRYVLRCTQLGYDIQPIEPEGWGSDEKEFARNEEYGGIVTKLSNNLKFTGDGAEYILLADELYDINAEIVLTRFEKHPRTDLWTRSYWGYLDMSTLSQENGKVSIKFNAGGLEQKIKAREDEDVEIDRPDTIDGRPLDALTVKEVNFTGRRIFLKSDWKATQDITTLLQVSTTESFLFHKAVGVPMTLNGSSHEQAQSILANSYSGGLSTNGVVGAMFLAIFDRTRNIIIKGQGLKFIPTAVLTAPASSFSIQACLTIFENGENYDFKERRELYRAGSGSGISIASIQDQLISIPDFEEEITVYAGDSVSLEYRVSVQFASGGQAIVTFKNGEGFLIVEEDSFFEPSKSKFILLHDVLERLTSICGNAKNIFYSEYFGRTESGYEANGPGAAVGLTHGMWIRGFDKSEDGSPSENNLFKPMTTSLQQALKSAIAVFNVGVGIEEVQGKERIRIENLSHFYNRNITMRLPNQVKNVKRSKAVNFYKSSVEVGYEAGGDYGEAQGLDEPNGKSNFTTILDRVKEPMSIISPFRADFYGIEFARRKPKLQFPSEDTPYDEDKFLLDLNPGPGSLYEMRKWQDDFEQAPTGIFSPETAGNLRLSPANILLRHWTVAAGLFKYPEEYVRYGSSTANSRLKTKRPGMPEIAENGNILNADLGKPLFIPQWIEFEHECNFDILQMVQGATVIAGKTIQNFYGTVEFLNEKNQMEYGFLFNLKPEGKGKWKLLKANR